MPSKRITLQDLFEKREAKIAFGIMLVLILWVASGVFKDEELLDSAANQQEKISHIPNVKIEPSIAKAFMRTLQLSAVTESPRMIDVVTQTSGIVEYINAPEGQMIYKNATIATLRGDARKARVTAAQAEVKQRQLEYSAAKKLAKSGLRAETALAQSFYQLKQAEAAMEEAMLDEEYGIISSPFTGLLNRIYVHEGEQVKSLETPVAQLITLDPMLVVGYVPEKWRRMISKNTSATIRFDDGGEVDGIVSLISFQSEEATRTFRIEVEMSNVNGVVPSGMNAEISIPLRRVEAHLIPSSALSLSDEGEVQVKYVDDQMTVHASTVSIVGEDEKGLWLSGLDKHINYISSGQAFVTEGDQVNVKQQSEKGRP